MAARRAALPALRVSDEAVRAKTGRTWPQWFSVLDRARARGRTHAEIAGLLRERFALPAWWSQMVTVAYEQARGRRVPHQTASGFSVSASLTVAAPVDALYAAWAKPRSRRAWLGGEALDVTTAHPCRSLRARWGDGATRLEVLFAPRGDGRSQVSVQHSRLADAAAARRMKIFWRRRLATLKNALGDA